MKKIDILFDHQIIKEDVRVISFSSDKIHDFEWSNNLLSLFVSDDADTDKIKANIKRLVEHKNDEKKDIEIEKSSVELKDYYSENDIFENGIIEKYSQGSITLNETGLKLFAFFDQAFMNIISDLNVIIKSFPTLLPCKTINDTNYLTSSPQYVLFCSKVDESLEKIENLQCSYNDKKVDECLTYPEVVLSPSACFPLYESLRGKIVEDKQIYTMLQNVFRNEGRFNWSELARLQDYHVREIVMIGDHKYVVDMRKKLLDRTIEFMKQLGIQYTVKIAADPFVVPRMQKYKLVQKFNEVKYEIKLNVNQQEEISCASFNLHGTSFSGKFDFKINNMDITESACVGFGLERWIIAFLAQFGPEKDNWPEMVRDYLEKNY